LDFEIVKHDLPERADGGVTDGDLRVKGFADLGQNHALEKGRAGCHEIDDHHQENENA
jgi:hypothetical protein